MLEDLSRSSDAVIVLLDSPDNLIVGLDYSAWRTGPKFMGIKSIPPGPHFLSWRPPDEEELNVLGLFLYFEPKEVCVRRWQADRDAFETVDEDDAERYRLGVARGEFYAHLGPYSVEFSVRWKELSRFISKETIARIEPVKKFVMSATKEYDAVDVARAKRLAGENVSVLQQLEPNDGIGSCVYGSTATLETEHVAPNTLFFCDIAKSDIPAHSTPSEVTKHSMDRSTVLLKLIRSHFSDSWKELLGELQFAYICFLLGQNHEAFEHWRDLVALICSCEEAVIALPELYEEFLRVLHGHITQVPEDFFDDVLTRGNFLVHCLSSLLEICRDERHPKRLRRRSTLVEDVIKSRLDHSVRPLLSRTEDAPVVVESTSQFISWNDQPPDPPPLDQECSVPEEKGR